MGLFPNNSLIDRNLKKLLVSAQVFQTKTLSVYSQSRGDRVEKSTLVFKNANCCTNYRFFKPSMLF